MLRMCPMPEHDKDTVVVVICGAPSARKYIEQCIENKSLKGIEVVKEEGESKLPRRDIQSTALPFDSDSIPYKPAHSISDYEILAGNKEGQGLPVKHRPHGWYNHAFKKRGKR